MDVKTLSIDVIGLSVRSTNALHRADIHTVGEMMEQTWDSLNTIKNLGKKSIDEVLEKILEYKSMDESREESISSEDDVSFEAPDDFDAWLAEDENRQLVINWLKKKNTRIESLEVLSAKAFNLLMFAGYDYVYQIAFLSVEELLEISRMDSSSAMEIERVYTGYLRDNKQDIFYYFEEELGNTKKADDLPLYEMINIGRYRDKIFKYVKTNDIGIDHMGLSKRPRTKLIDNGYCFISEIIGIPESELIRIPKMGVKAVHEIVEKIKEYLDYNESRIRAYLSGDEEVLLDDSTIRQQILSMYEDVRFGGLSFNDFMEKLRLPEPVSVERVKGIIGHLIAEGELEYVDYRCYRVYGKFEDYVLSCTDIDEREREFIIKRLQGNSLETIANEHGLTRERVRQITKKGTENVRYQYIRKTGMSLFDEDYYRYLYATYYFNKADGSEWLGVSPHVWNYLELYDMKRGKKDLETALEDQEGLDVGLRIRIKNYLNRNKLYIDGRWVEKKRADLEQVVVKKFCTDDVTFDDFCKLYNDYLEQEEIPFDEKLYYVDVNLKSRKNTLSDSRFLLWKLNEKIRYYDIDGRDYSELLDTLNFDSYENIELSTLKLFRDNPEIMEKYDIRDQYELHNLLRKIVHEGDYHDFHCGRMPDIRFGEFDRDKAIMDIIMDSAPISQRDLADLISEEYGYDTGVIIGNYLQNFTKYYHQGIYYVDQKKLDNKNMELLRNELKDDFYYIDEIRNIYKSLIPDADIEEINPFNLKSMGFTVYCRYALKNYSSLEEYITSLLTCDDIVDITKYRKRFVYVLSFYTTLAELKRTLRLVEFEPNQIVSFSRLEQSGVTREKIQDFCDNVYDFVENNEYFTAQSLRQAGLETELYDLGFSDWFYANLLISDDRFSFANMLGNIILFKGDIRISFRSFVTEIINRYGCIDTYDLISEISGKYGCREVSKYDLTYKTQGTAVYYDGILDRFYANKDLYYKEIEEGGF